MRIRIALTPIWMLRVAIVALAVATFARADEKSAPLTIRTDSVVGDEIIVPSPQAIKRLDVSVYNSPLKLRPIESFEVPPKHYEEIMQYFLHAAAEQTPAKVVREEGILRVVTTDGRVQHITFYWTGGKTPLRFSIMGQRCIRDPQKSDGGDDALAVELLIRDVYRKVTGENTFKPVTE